MEAAELPRLGWSLRRAIEFLSLLRVRRPFGRPVQIAGTVGINRKYLLLGVDLFWVALSPFAALFIRDHFAPRAEALTATILYACLRRRYSSRCFSDCRPQSQPCGATRRSPSCCDSNLPLP